MGTAARPRWWLLNLITVPAHVGVLCLLVGQGYQGLELHKMSLAIGAGIFGVASMLAGVLVAAADFQEGRFVGPRRFGAWLGRQVLGCLSGVGGLASALLVHLLILLALQVAHPVGLPCLLLILVPAFACFAALGVTLRMLVPWTALAIPLGVLVLLCFAALPFFCCVPQANPAVATYYVVERPADPSVAGAGESTLVIALLLACAFGVPTQLFPLAVFIPACVLRHQALARALAPEEPEESASAKEPEAKAQGEPLP